MNRIFPTSRDDSDRTKDEESEEERGEDLRAVAFRSHLELAEASAEGHVTRGTEIACAKADPGESQRGSPQEAKGEGKTPADWPAGYLLVQSFFPFSHELREVKYLGDRQIGLTIYKIISKGINRKH